MTHGPSLRGAQRRGNLGCCVTADDQLDSAQATPIQAAQELSPKRLSLTGADFEAQDLALALCVDPHSDYYGHTHDATSFSGFDIGGVDPKVGPVALNDAIEEGAHTVSVRPTHLDDGRGDRA